VALPALQPGEIHDPARLLAFFGRGSGILGLTALLLAALISARIPGLDLWFGGLTHLWKVHHLLGAVSFLLLMAHPLLLAFAAAPVSVQAAAAVLCLATQAWSLWSGWLALGAMAFFLAPTFWFFGQPRYQRWKALHALSGLAIVLGLMHALPLSRSLPGASGRAIWTIYGSLALLAFIYRLWLAPRTARRRYTIASVEVVAPGIVELALKPAGPVLSYAPGQFVYLTPLDSALASGCNEEHPYTLSSAPNESVLRIVIKDAGDATRALQRVRLHSEALVEGPYGDLFPQEQRGEKELWIAGGIGLTPFLSRARTLAAAEPGGAAIDLIYCVQDESRAHFRTELENIASAAPRFRLWMHYYDREGPLTARFIADCCPDFTSRQVFLCGPAALMDLAWRELRRHKIPAGRIHSEEFTWL
jgi:predicted ferric reductase